MRWLRRMLTWPDPRHAGNAKSARARRLSFEECEGRLMMSAFADITAYRPQQASGSYAPFARTAVSERAEDDPRLGPGIRINGDDDNRNGTPDRTDAAVAGEDDLIEAVLRAGGGSYVLERSNTSVRVWTSASKGVGSEIVFAENRSAPLDFPASGTRTVWVEWAAPGHGMTRLTVKPAPGSPSATPRDSALFHTFMGIVVALGGEGQVPSSPLSSNQGIFQVAARLYDEGFDARMYDEDYVTTSGTGVVYDEIVSAVRTRRVWDVAAIGYSHGGGATYRLSERLTNNRAQIGAFRIAFTAYVDAVQNDSDYDMDQERRRPPGSLYHVNYYQRGTAADFWLDGGPTEKPPGADYELDVETTAWGAGATHFTVDDLSMVKNGVHDRLAARVFR